MTEDNFHDFIIGSANIFCKGPDTVTTTWQLQQENSGRQYENAEVWLYFNKTLFIKTGRSQISVMGHTLLIPNL